MGIKYKYINHIIFGDCYHILDDIPSDSIDLIFTSPPYAGKRMEYYSVSPDEYVDWFIPITNKLFRVLKPTGSFILNIKEGANNGERLTYVIQLILAMKANRWLWIEEYIWHKKNSYPGKWPNRFRDGWERLLHFTKLKTFFMNQEAVMVPVGDWAKDRLDKLSPNDASRSGKEYGSGFGRVMSNWVGRSMVYPNNVIYMATECANRSHPAAFPITLPEWFIKLFTNEGGLVLDPFVGSGTTCVAAINLNRNHIGIDNSAKYVKLARNRLAKLMEASDG